ncbi:MAG TPA: hypothetical protein VEQ42_12015 [Pyrinomonadaceae bacterium]|nr:hypothetical protein [Pyrinomonadaceae bacterium]
MKNLLDIVLGIVAAIALIIAVWQFYLFVSSPGAEGNTTHLWYAIGSAIVLCVCALGIFLRHVNKEEEIHITQ